MHRILLAVDSSKIDHRVFEQACEIALAWEAKLFIVHVDDSHSHSDEHVEAAKHDLAKLVPEDLAISYQYLFRQGDPEHLIRELESQLSIDLIVLGTHARHGIKRWISGSVAESIIRSAGCPVMTLRLADQTRLLKQADGKEVPRFLVPVDFSVHSYVAIEFATALASVMGGELTVVHVEDKAAESPTDGVGFPVWTESRQHLWDHLKQFVPHHVQVPANFKLLPPPAKTSIAAYANEKHYHAVVLGTHGRTGVGHALVGSVAEQVVRHAACPVFTVKPGIRFNPDLFFAKHVASNS